jgi:hypothetical protein
MKERRADQSLARHDPRPAGAAARDRGFAVEKRKGLPHRDLVCMERRLADALPPHSEQHTDALRRRERHVEAGNRSAEAQLRPVRVPPVEHVPQVRGLHLAAQLERCRASPAPSPWRLAALNVVVLDTG